MNVSRQLVNDEDGTGTFSRDGVLDVALAFIRVRMNL